jgi:uncharacterized repeat protein (TIGR02543 family)
MGSFSTNISGLDPLTFYYYRCWASNLIGAAWAPATTNFVTMAAGSPPTVNNGSGASSITTNSAQLNGVMVANSGMATPTYIYWGTNDGGTVKASWEHEAFIGTIWSVCPFATNITSLTPGTFYYYRSWASNVYGTSWASETTNFMTAGVGPLTIQNQPACDVTSDSATMNAQVISIGGGTWPYITCYWGTNDAGVNIWAWENTNALGMKDVGPVSNSVSSLSPNTTYFYRFYATNNTGEALTPASMSFVTMGGAPGYTRFRVYGLPPYLMTGQVANVTVQAWKGTNLWTDYTGTVHFSSSDVGTTLPSDYTFALGDGGVHAFPSPVIFHTAGEHFDVTVNDLTDFAMRGDQHDIAVFNGYGTALSRFVLAGLQDPITTSEWESVSVGAVDEYFNLVTNYTGIINFSSSDGTASLPQGGSKVYAFTGADGGWHTFSNDLQFNSIGEHWLHVADDADTNITATAWNLTVQGDGYSSNVSHFVLEYPRWTMTNEWHDLFVSARNIYERDVTNFTGSIDISCSDPSASYPVLYTFAVADEGRHSFTNFDGVQFVTPGDNQWIEARWQANTNIMGGVYGIHVDSGMGIGGFEIEVRPIALAGTPMSVTIKAIKGDGLVDTNYTGTVDFFCSDGSASYPSSYSFALADYGVFSTTLTLNAGGLQEFWCEESGNAAKAGDEEIEVLAGGATNTTHFRMETRRKVTFNGVSNDVFVVALGDGNLVNLTHTANVDFTCPDGPATFGTSPFNGFVNGMAFISNQVAFLSTGDQTLRVALSSDTNVFGETEMFVAGGGNTYYVNQRTGVDTNNGLSAATAWKTLNKAAVSAFAGDTVIVAPGKYKENVVLQETGAAGLWITFYADDGGQFFGQPGPVCIDPEGGSGIDVNYKTYIAIAGFEIYPPSSGSGTGIVAYGASNVRLYENEIGNMDVGIYIDGASDPVISGNLIEQCTTYGIRINNTADNMRLEKNDIQNCGQGLDLYISAINISITGNNIEGCPNGGVYLKYGQISQFQFNSIDENGTYGMKIEFSSSSANIRNNIFYNNGGPGILLDGAGTGSQIINNSSISNDIGISLINTDGAWIRNNILAFNTSSGVWADSASTNSWDWRYNCVYGSPIDYANAAAMGTGDISVDPLLACGIPGEEDAHLQSQGGRATPDGWAYDLATSPCIDAGDPTDDWSLEPAPNGGRINMGRYGGTREASRSASFDGDGDGMPDGWEIYYFGTTNALPNSDDDTDSMPNLDEYTAGTDPTNSLSLLAFSASSITNSHPAMGWNSVSGRLYTIEHTSNYWTGGWMTVTAGLNATPPFNYFEDALAPSGTSRFYRVSAKFDSTNMAECVGLIGFHWVMVANGPGGWVNDTNSWLIHGEMPTFTAFPSNGYHFTGWSGSLNSTSNPITVTVTQSVSITANFEINTNAIVAGAGPNGQIAPTGTVWVAYGGSTNFSITPNANYHVTNVMVDGSPIGPTNNFTFINVTNGGHTITALFGIDQHTLTVASPWGAPTPPVGVVTCDWNTATNASVNSPVILGATQYVCTGWIGAGDVTNGIGTNTSFTITTNSSITWTWGTTYWLAPTSMTANGGVNVAPAFYPAGSNIAITATPSNGWHFSAWSGDTNGCILAGNVITAVMTQPRTIAALFAINTYDITATNDPNGTIAPSGTVFVNHGGATNFAITPNANYHVTNVVVDGAPIGPTNSFTFLNVTNGGHTITALFGIDQYTLTVASPWGAPAPPVGVVTCDWNTATNASVPTPVNNGATQYTCIGWSGTGSVPLSGTSNSVSFNLTNASTLTWLWQTNFYMTANSADDSQGSVNFTGGYYRAGTNLSITAVVSNGYHFSNWAGSFVTNDNPINFILNEPYAITANFAINTYDITATNGPNGIIAPSGTVFVNHGGATNFAITPNANYHVTNVVVDGAPIGPTNSFTFLNVTNGGHTITAFFGVDQYPLTVASPYGVPTPTGTTTNNWNDFVNASVAGSPAVFGNTQYVCSGWTGTGSVLPNGSGTNTSFAITNASTLLWRWSTNYWLAPAAGPNGNVNVAPAFYAMGSNITITATPSNGYHFVNWTGDLTTNANPLTVTMPKPYPNLQANFAVDTNSIVAAAGPNGSISPSGTIWVPYGSSTNFVITPNANYHTTNVLVDGSSIGATNTYTFVNVTNTGHTIVALFGADQYTLTVASAYGTPAPAGITSNDYGSLINASISGSPVGNGTTQYLCVGWAGSGSAPASGTASNTSFTITANSTLTWNWQTQYQLAPIAGANGAVDLVAAWYRSGTNVTITATPDSGYHFAGWTGDVPAALTNNNPLTVAMTQARAVTANFAEDIGSVTVTLSPAAAISAGAQWRMTTGPDTTWHNSGDVISGVNAGGAPYTIAFQTVAGWTAPPNITTVTVTDGGLTSETGTYLMGAMTFIPGGTFQMGILNGAGGHAVTLSDFYMDVREVTVADYQAFCLATGAGMPSAPLWNPAWANTTLPIVNVTWSEAAAYAAWAGKRLPTEAEFEYAMRSGAANSLYPWGNTITAANANYGNTVGLPTVAGSYPGNGYGLYDIAGNVWEWCADWYQSVQTGPVTDPTGPAGGTSKIIRSGSYINSSLRLRCAPRYSLEPSVRYADLGFRCASGSGMGSGEIESDGDANKNGIPDWWEEWYFGGEGAGAGEGTGFDSTADSDGDGLNNGQEYVAGTDPTRADSTLAIEEGQPALTGNGFVIKWSSAAGKLYSVERSPDLTQGFNTVATNISATPPMNTYTDTVGTSGLYFYRIQIK